MGIDYRVLRFYDYMSREDYNEYPYDFLRVTTGDDIIETRTLVDSENIRISMRYKIDLSTYYIMYNINRPWSRYNYSSEKIKNMSRMIPMFKDNVNMAKLFEYRNDKLDLRLRNIELSYTNYKHLRYEVVEGTDTAYKCEDDKYLGYCKIVDNKFTSEKCLLIVDFPDESNNDTGYVQVISLPSLENIIRYEYKHTENENPLCADFPIEVNDKPIIIGTESTCIDSSDPVVYGNYSAYGTCIYYRPRIRYIEDWDLPIKNIVYEEERSEKGECMRWVLQADENATLEQVRDARIKYKKLLF